MQIPVHTIEKDADAWFVAKDLCDVLEIGNPSQALSRLDDDEKGIILNDTLGGQQNMSTVNESGMYSLVMTSRKPEAKAFKKWVTSEVISSIRKAVKYAGNNPRTTLSHILSTKSKPILILAVTAAIVLHGQYGSQ